MQNDLQQAINDAANNGINEVQDQLGVPPMPPADGADAPFEAAFSASDVEMPPVGGEISAPKMPAEEAADSSAVDMPTPVAEGAASSVDSGAADASDVSEPSAEAILSDTITTPESVPANDFSATREGILRDLMPLMDKVEGEPEKKFNIYKDAMDTLHDKNLVTGAYKEAAKITDENKKADALMTLLNAIDTL